MILINRRERQLILEKYPRTEIVSTKNRYYLVTDGKDTPARMLYDLRGIQPPPTRQERAAAARSGNGYGYDRQRRPYQRRQP